MPEKQPCQKVLHHMQSLNSSKEQRHVRWQVACVMTRFNHQTNIFACFQMWLLQKCGAIQTRPNIRKPLSSSLDCEGRHLISKGSLSASGVGVGCGV